jgi:hypothetical protein
MMKNDTLAELVKWPTKPEEVSVDLMLRITGAVTQRIWLDKWAAMERDGVKPSPLYMAQTDAVISGVGLMACLCELRDVNPEKAEEFARDYWNMCDAGDSFGELLWEYTERAGLDPELVRQAMEATPAAIVAVDPVDGSGQKGPRAPADSSSELLMLGRPVPPPPPEETEKNENDLTRVGPLTAGVGGQDLAQSGDRASPPLPGGSE